MSAFAGSACWRQTRPGAGLQLFTGLLGGGDDGMGEQDTQPPSMRALTTMATRRRSKHDSLARCRAHSDSAQHPVHRSQQ